MNRSPKRVLSWSVMCILIASLIISAGVPYSTVSAKSDDDTTVDVQLLSITDFHGYLQPMNDVSNGQIWSPDGQLVVGGAPYIATHLKQLKAGHRNSILFAAGDNFSGWPFEVAAFRDEPTIEFMNKIGVEFTAVGNHEFDEEKDFLLKHMAKGVCLGEHDKESCFTDSTGKKFSGADMEFISANVREVKSDKLALKPYIVKQVEDSSGKKIPIGFIGLTTPETVLGTTSFQEGIITVDPLVEAANRYAKELQDMGVQTIVAVVHEGGTAGGGFQACTNPTGPVIRFAQEVSSAIDVIVTGHWHAAFNCMINDPDGNPRPVVEAAYHGKLINEINLSIDPVTQDVLRDRTQSVNHPVTRDVDPDPEVAQIASYWKQRGEELYAQPVAEITGDLTRARNINGESTLANFAADAHYAAGQKAERPADFALTASSPLRGDLRYAKGTNPADRDGLVLFGEQWHAHGYANPVVVVSLTGSQIDQILEEQWRQPANDTIGFFPLAVSHNVRYSYDTGKPLGERVNPADVLINGVPLDPDKTYRIAALAYLIRGADGYPGFLKYTEPERVIPDHWAFYDYVREQKVIEPPALNRVSQK